MTAARGADREGSIHKPSFWFYLLFPLVFLGFILLLLAAMQYKQLKAVVADRPAPLAPIANSPEAQARALERLAGFFGPAGGDSLALSADDLNQLIRSSAALSALGLDYHLELNDTLLVARNSLPVSGLRGGLSLLARAFGIRGYLNSEMRGYPRLRDGMLEWVPISGIMNGQSAPASALTRKGNVLVRAWVEDTTSYDRALRSLAEVKVSGGAMLLIKRR